MSDSPMGQSVCPEVEAVAKAIARKQMNWPVNLAWRRYVETAEAAIEAYLDTVGADDESTSDTPSRGRFDRS